MKKINSAQISIPIALIIIGFVAMFAPAALQTYTFSPNQMKIIAMLWIYNIGFVGNPFMIGPMVWFITFALTFLRLAFVVMIYRVYQGKTTLKRCSIIGMVSEIQIPLMLIIPNLLILPSLPGIDYIPVVIPIPFLIMVGVIITRVLKPPVTTQWIERVESDNWFDETKTSETSSSGAIEEGTTL